MLDDDGYFPQDTGRYVYVHKKKTANLQILSTLLLPDLESSLTQMYMYFLKLFIVFAKKNACHI